MDDYTSKIQEICLDLFEKGEVEKIIGYAEGSIPMATDPVVVSSAENVKKLTFNSTCSMNIANYMRDIKTKTAIIAKGCDSRNIVTHIVENQVDKENIYVIGVPCSGMVDKNKIRSLLEDEIISFTEQDSIITIVSVLKKKEIPKQDVLKDNCLLCTCKNPVNYDVLAGDLVEEQTIENLFPDVDALEDLSIDDRWEHFQKLTQNCIRCYACKNACPLCYCPTCFVDESAPQWVGKGQDKTDVDTFHFLRAFHCAGRCTDCGACVEACPMGINVRDFTRKLNKDCYDLFGWEAGLDVSKRPPLDTYSADDPDDFIK